MQANIAAGQDLPSVYQTWRVYTVRDGLPSDRIGALRYWNDELWVGTAGGLARFKAGVWKSWPTPDEEPPATITGIDIDPDTHEVWFGTLGGGLLRMSAERMSRLTQLNSGLAGDLVFAVAVADKTIWAATNGGVSAYDPVRERWELFAERRADETETAVVGFARQTDRLYYAAWCGGVASFGLRSDISGVLDTSETKVDARPTADDSTIGIASIDDTVWRITPTSARRIDPKAAGEAFKLDLPSDAFIECAAFRRPGELWVGSDSGVRVLADPSTNTWLSYEQSPAGGAARVLARRAGKIVAKAQLQAGLPETPVRCIAFDAAGVWVGTDAGLVRGTDPTPWNKLAPIDADPSAAQVAAVLRHTLAPASQKSPPGACIGVLGPFKRTIMLPRADSTPAQASHRADLTAAQIAVSTTGEPGKDEGGAIRVEYIPGGFASYAWRLPEDDIVLLAAHGDAAIVGAFRPEERISYVAARGLQVPMMNASNGPVTTAEASSPWGFRCRIDDPRAHNALLDHVIDDLDRTRIAIVRTPDAAAELHLDWWSKHARSRGHAAILDVAFDLAGDDPKPLIEQLRRADPTAILTWTDARQSAAILRLLRAAGLSAALVVSDEAVRDEFIERCGPSPGDVVAPYPCPHRQDPASPEKLAEHYGRQPQPLSAVLTFDAVQHAMDAIRAAGPDRRAIREELVRTSRFAAARLEGGRWIRWPKDADSNRADAALASQPADSRSPSAP